MSDTKPHPMSPTRAAALEAVAEAAWRWQASVLSVFPRTDEEQEAYEAFDNAICTLDALSSLPAEPEPEGEMVTLGLMEHRGNRKLAACTEPNQEDHRYWAHIGNLTFRRPARPVVPEVVAEVVKP